MKDQDPKNMSVINDLKKGHGPVEMGKIDGDGFVEGELSIISAENKHDEAARLESQGKRQKDVIIIGGDAGLSHKLTTHLVSTRGYKLTDLDGDSNVIPKIHDDCKRGSVLRHVSRKKEIRVEPKPITLRNLFDVPPRFEA